jgi:hypothetical protein
LLCLFYYNHRINMNKKTRALQLLSYVFGVLLVVSVFKNISYPLFWADESMTAMGSERVVKYGYPKAHDGKNVLNDMFCSTPKIAVNEKDDAFIGGANWGQYYFGAISYLLASNFDDIYTKTGIFRSTFSITGLLGLFLLALAMSTFFEDKFYKHLFISIFLLCELISVSLALHLREVRYYSPALFFSSLIISLYVLHRFRKPFNKIFYSIAFTALLWIVFNIFSPLYFIFILAIVISESVICIFQYFKIKKLKESILPCLPTFAAIIISYIGVYPLLGYFKTFEMKKVLDDFYHINSDIYWQHFFNELRYFRNLELLWLAVVMRAGVLINLKKALRENSKVFRVSNFLTLLFIIFLFSIPNIDSPMMFTRYLIYMQPVLSVIAIFDFILLLKLFSANSKYILADKKKNKEARKNKPVKQVAENKFWNTKTSLLVAIFTILFGFTFTENLPYLQEHIYEMTNQYKGPLDYTIPYIKSNYTKPEDLIIATNYEETSYMYYLKSKVIIGFVGNNLPEDTVYQPDIISFRQTWGGVFPNVFRGFLRKASYKVISFPGKDIPVNNIPELNVDQPVYNHYFQSVTTDNKQEEVNLFIKM